jgi:hypothetical protein
MKNQATNLNNSLGIGGEHRAGIAGVIPLADIWERPLDRNGNDGLSRV